MEPKTKGSRRRVPLPRQTAELLRGYLAELHAETTRQHRYSLR